MKKILSLMIAIMVVLSSVAVLAVDSADTAEITFKDVNAETDTGKAIYKLVDAGILNGYLDGTFKPGNTLTRAELCKIINLVFGYTEADTENFKDVKKDDWFYNYVAVAKKAGYINGFEDGTFRGNEKLTREQACAIIVRAGNLFDLPMTEKITDKVSDWAVPYVNKVVANKLMSLEAGGKFRATENITRGELVLVSSNFVVEEENTDTNEITVNVNIEGNGKVTGAGKYEKGKEVTLKASLELGYVFSGWFVNNKNVSKNTTYTFKAEKNMTVTAKFTKEAGGGGGGGAGGSTGGGNDTPATTYYTVSFDTDGGSAVTSQSIESGKKATKPTSNPTKTGHDFTGWYTSKGGSTAFDFTKSITANTTVYAGWKAKTYTVSFSVDGGSAVDDQTVEYGKTVTKPAAPNKAGFKFGGWYTSAGCSEKYDFTKPVTGNITIWAGWEVEFDAALQKKVRDSVKAFYDELVIKLDPIEGELYEDFTTDILTIVQGILKSVVDDADIENKAIYDDNYIRTEYGGLIDDAKDIYTGLDVTDRGLFEADILGTFDRERADELLKMIFGVGLDDIKDSL